MNVVVCGLKNVPSPFGGVERCVEETCSRLAARGHTITVYTRDECERQQWHNGFIVYQLPHRPSKYLSYYTYMARAFSRILRNHNRTTLIHVHSPSNNALWAAMLRLLGYRVIIQSHGFTWRSPRWPLWYKMIQKGAVILGAVTANAVICVSKEEVEHYERIHAWRALSCHRIPNGISAPDPAPNSELLDQYDLSKGGYYLFVGRLVPEKSALDLLYAFHLAKTRKKLVLVGGGSFSDDYVKQLERLANKTDGVILTGYLDHDMVMQLHQHAYAFILPSLTEGCPIALLEAVSCGTVCVAADIKAHRDISETELLLFPVGDVTALSALMQKLERSPEFYEQSRNNVRRLSRNLMTWDDVALSVESVYREVAPERNAQ